MEGSSGKFTDVVDVLVVDGDPGAAGLVAASLQDHPLARFRCLCAGTLAEGLGMLHEHAFDAVLLDLGLPDSSGLEGLDRIHGEMPDLPVIVLTGRDDEGMAIEAIRHGAQDYLVKGLSLPRSRVVPRVLLRTISRKKAEKTPGALGASGKAATPESLEALRELLLAPVFPEEFESWVAQLAGALEQMRPRMESVLIRESEERLREWEERAPHLGARILMLRRVDRGLWADFEKLRTWTAQLNEQAGSREVPGGSYREIMSGLIEKGLRLIVRYERRQATVEYWTYEVLERDMGSGD